MSDAHDDSPTSSSPTPDSSAPRLRVLEPDGDAYIPAPRPTLEFDELDTQGAELLPHLPTFDEAYGQPHPLEYTMELAPAVTARIFERSGRPPIITIDWERLESHHPWMWPDYAMGAYLGLTLQTWTSRAEDAGPKMSPEQAAEQLGALLKDRQLEFPMLEGLLQRCVQGAHHEVETSLEPGQSLSGTSLYTSAFFWLCDWYPSLRSWARKAFELPRESPFDAPGTPLTPASKEPPF